MTLVQIIVSHTRPWAMEQIPDFHRILLRNSQVLSIDYTYLWIVVGEWDQGFSQVPTEEGTLPGCSDWACWDGRQGVVCQHTDWNQFLGLTPQEELAKRQVLVHQEQYGQASAIVLISAELHRQPRPNLVPLHTVKFWRVYLSQLLYNTKSTQYAQLFAWWHHVQNRFNISGLWSGLYARSSSESMIITKISLRHGFSFANCEGTLQASKFIKSLYSCAQVCQICAWFKNTSRTVGIVQSHVSAFRLTNSQDTDPTNFHSMFL